MPKKKEECKQGAPEYMTTYGDMMTLLLCFFVLLFAMSTVNPNKFKVAASSFQNALSGVLESFPTILITKEVMIPKMGGDEQNKRMAVEAATRLKRNIREKKLEESVRVKVTDKGFVIRLKNPIAFDLGKADIKGGFRDILDEVIGIINDLPGKSIRVEGHTDNIPIHTPIYPSNWELSAARAISVVKYLYQEGGIDPSRLSAVGYGKFRPLVPNTSAQNRQKNRRTEIYVEYVKKAEEENNQEEF